MKTTLESAVIRRIGGKDSLRDVCRGGADGGFPGFTYYRDTCDFYRKHRAAIVKMAEDMANDLGDDVLKMVAGFRCLNGDFTPTEVARVMYGRWDDKSDAHTMIGNALAWFALETVAHNLFPEE